MKRKKLRSLSILLSASMIAGSVVPQTAFAAAAPDVSEEAQVLDLEAPENETEGSEDLVVPEETEAVTDQGDEIVIDADGEEGTGAVIEDNSAVGDALQVEKEAKGQVQADGINDAWAIDKATEVGGETCKVEDGWLHMEAVEGNGNGTTAAAKYPAVFVNPNEFDFTKAGYFEFDVNSTQDTSKNRFGIYIGYENPGQALFLGYDADGWFWQKYGETGNPWYQGERISKPNAGTSAHVRVEWTADHEFQMFVDGKSAFGKVEDFSGITGLTNKIAFKIGGWGAQLTSVYLKNIHYTGQATVEAYSVTGSVKDSAGKAIAGAQVKLGEQSVKTAADGTYALENIANGTYTLTVGAEGYVSKEVAVTVDKGDVTVPEVVLERKGDIPSKTLSTDEMDVLVAENFPSVVRYEMKGNLAGKHFYGQTGAIDTIKVNGIDIKVTKENLKTTFNKDTATYVMTLKGGEGNNKVDAVITAELKAEKNTVAFNITKVENNLSQKDANGYEIYPIQTIAIPNHSLVSVRSSQDGANLKGARVSQSTMKSGDDYVDVTDKMTFAGCDFMYGFVSNEDLSAGLWSNSEYNGTAVQPYVWAGGACNTRVLATVEDVDASLSVGLGSTEWYYDRKVTPTVNGEKRTYVVKHGEMPSAKVTIAGDMNDDKTINWQDGAIAYREIMNNPTKSEEVPELVSQRIVENFQSQATNPFLATLDGVNRVYLNTDGLGQSILLKGYGSEGHDSGHPDYGNIGERIGGAADMNTLLTKGKTMGAVFGVHINADEMYTEAKAFNDELSRGNYGWNWLDQGIGINGLYDLASGSREKRLQDLYDQVGNNLDFIYLDVWGNQTSGAEDSWESRNIARQITSKGWRFTTEWGGTHEYDSTMQHWAADLNYGGYAAKGQNSEVMRFIRNHQKDSWIADYPSYGGAAQAPLLGGLNMTDFEGWSGRTDYDNYIKVMFRHNLITKFLQHYKVSKWVDGTPVSVTNGAKVTANWTPEMEITLQDDNKDNTVVVKRGSNDYSDLANYRSRTITLNGTVISQGAVTGGDGSNAGNETYLVPWYWDSTGKKLAAKDEKLYHWNTKGGTTTWTLPEGWEGLSTVNVYELTDSGKTNEQTVQVTDGQITLTDMAAEVPYVVYKGKAEQLKVDWQSTPYIYDTGFNSTEWNQYWAKAGTGTADIVDNKSANSMLMLAGDVSVTSEALTNLKAGQRYALYVGVDNTSDAKAYMTVKNGNTVLATNYTKKSFVENVISTDQHHTGSGATVVGGNGTSCFQNMYVFFTAPKSGEVTLTLGREALTDETEKTGAAYFDDIRVVETAMDLVKETNKDGYVTKFVQDFENNVQGLYPFVVAGPGGPADGRMHLSEANGKYTKAGYRDKRVDDVLGGNWSVKINGLVGNDHMIYQTVPQNFRFEPGVTYNISFDYQLGSEETYVIKIGDGKETTETVIMPVAIGETKRISFTLTGSESGESWFGIYSTGKSADMREFANAGEGPRNFSGYKDFVLDELTIQSEKVSISQTEIETKTAKDKYQLSLDFADEKDKDAKVTWSSTDENVAVVDENGTVTLVGYGTADISATVTLDGDTFTFWCNVKLLDGEDVNAKFVDVYANTEEIGGEPAPSGPAAATIDGSTGTYWHSNWSNGGFTVSEDNPAILTAVMSEGDDAANYEKLTIYQRPSGSNGIISKFVYVIGNTFDEGTNTITDGVVSDPITVKSAQAGGSVEVELPEGITGKYVQIRVLNGSNGFAAMGELIASKWLPYATDLEKAYLAANNADVVKAQAQAAYDAIKDSGTEEEVKAAKAALDTAIVDMNLLRATADQLEAQAAYDAIKDSGTEEEIKTATTTLNFANANLKIARAAESILAAQKELENATTDEEKQAAQAKIDVATEEQKFAEDYKKSLEDLQAAEDAKAEAEKKAEEEKKKAEEAAKKAEEAEKKAQEAEEAAKKAEADRKAEEAAKEAAKKDAEEARAKADAAQKASAEEKAKADAAQKALDEAKAAAAKLQQDLDAANKKLADIENQTLKKGDTVTYKNVTYKVLDANKKTVAAVKGKNVTSLSIASSVKVKGITCKVVEISSKAFRNASKLKKVTIGSNVTKIGSYAFYNAKKLKTVVIKSTKLKSVGSKAFTKIYSKAKISVPKSKKTTYKKLLKKKVPTKATIK